MSDFTTVTLKRAIFFNKRFMAARHEEGCYEKFRLRNCFFAKDYPTMTSGRIWGTEGQQIRPGACTKTSDFVKEKLGVLPRTTPM